MTYPGLLIDYGHGGMLAGAYQTAGKRYRFNDGLNVYEGVTNREIAARLIRIALGNGVRVYDVVAGCEWATLPCAHDLAQEDVSLTRRVNRANERRDWLYVSLHSNAVGNVVTGDGHPANGVIVFTSRGQTKSDAVADTLAAAFGRGGFRVRADMVDGDSDQEADFYVLTKTRGAAVLVEHGFHTNRQDAGIITSEEGQARIAAAYWAGLKPWLVG